MRLRQIALIAQQIAPVAEALEAVFDLKVAFRDPAVGVFGLANVVMAVGGEFLEVLEPIRPDASGARYLVRRGGDAGYMVILQSDDALAARTRIVGLGARVIAARDEGPYRFTHFHPADCAGVLLSIDQVVGADPLQPMGDWPPAGPNWRDHPSTLSGGIAAVTVQARDPAAVAHRWSKLLDTPVDGAQSLPSLTLEAGVIRFCPPADADGTGVVGLDIEVADVAEVLARARHHGAPVRDGAVVICGTALRPMGRGGS